MWNATDKRRNSTSKLDKAMRKLTIEAVAVTALLGTIPAAQAGFVTYDSPGSTVAASTIGIVGNNEFRPKLGALGVTNYTLGASLGVDNAGSVSYYYYGKEAGYQNVFLAGNFAFSTGFTPTTQNYFNNPIKMGSLDVGSGLLDFAFCAFGSPLFFKGCVTNDQNDDLGWNSYQSIAYSVAGNTAWLFWDDSGAGPDDNHDDMLIKAVFTPKAVPEPATLGLFGLGMLGAWFATRRRKLA
jgi:hypothetical protein